MLPDFRVVIIAVISTFLLTVGVGFYTSSRLLNEPRKSRSESLASLEDSPISRIALNWPEPVQQTPQLDLDFAVTLNGSRNPVRDITDETSGTQAELKVPESLETAVDIAPQDPAPSADATVATTDEPAAKVEPAPVDEPALIQAAQEIPAHEMAQEILTAPAPALEIEPATAGLTLVMRGAEAIVAPISPPVEEPAATALQLPASTPESPAEEPHRDPTAQPEKPDTTIETASGDQSDPEETGTIIVHDNEIPIPQVKPDVAIPEPHKAIVVTKRPRRHVKRYRPRLKKPAPAPTPTLFFPFNLFIQPNQFYQFNQTNQPNQSNPVNQPTSTSPTR